jgi:hypothetical protein
MVGERLASESVGQVGLRSGAAFVPWLLAQSL